MFNSTTKKRIQALGIMFLIFGTFTSFFNIMQTKFTSNDTYFNNEVDEKYDNDFNHPKVADYSSNYSNSGRDLDVSLHQSLIKEGTPLFEIINASDSNNNTFYIDCPNETTFNSTESTIYVDNIYAPNKSITFEDDLHSSKSLFNEKYAASFTVEGSGYLENISVFIQNGFDLFNGTLELQIYKSKWANNMHEPDGLYSSIYTNYNFYNFSADWYTFENVDVWLDVSATQNNTFFVTLFDDDDGTLWWYEIDPPHLASDGINDIDCWREGALPGDWDLALDGTDTIDFNLRCDFVPKSNIPFPADIGLKINNTAVSNNTKGSGNAIITKGYSTLPTQLDYELTAEWWDVSCNITKIQVNFTKTDLKARSIFEVLGSGQVITWNVSIGNLNYFDSDFGNYWINFTVPVKWSNFQAFNDTIELTDNTSLGPVENGYRQYQIYNTSNGPNWYITAESQNLLHNIHTYVNTFELSTVDFTDVLSFLANFSETITDGAINLSVYSPDPGYYLRHNYFNDSLDPDIEISLGSWTISENATEYGQYKIQVTWHNDTAGGFLEKNLTIMAVTDLVLISPPLNQNRFLDDIFNITVFYNDTGKNLGDQGIAGAEIAVNDTYIAWVDEGNGDYKIEVNS
ncbi:MAG: hypothetical protein ACFE75_02600, partial [Candidatus Hodarchaeota archaeon]